MNTDISGLRSLIISNASYDHPILLGGFQYTIHEHTGSFGPSQLAFDVIITAREECNESEEADKVGVKKKSNSTSERAKPGQAVEEEDQLSKSNDSFLTAKDGQQGGVDEGGKTVKKVEKIWYRAKLMWVHTGLEGEKDLDTKQTFLDQGDEAESVGQAMASLLEKTALAVGKLDIRAYGGYKER